MIRSRSRPSVSTRRFDSPEQEVYLGLWRTYDRLRALETAFFAEYSLTAQQYNVLRILKAERPATVPTLLLAERLISRAPDITRMLDALEQRGLVSRVRSTTDRRSVGAGITTKGVALLDQMAEPLRECHARQLGHLSGADLKTLGRLLREARLPHETESTEWR
jgi:DNA-binding MarR family transcriptional regulator